MRQRVFSDRGARSWVGEWGVAVRACEVHSAAGLSLLYSPFSRIMFNSESELCVCAFGNYPSIIFNLRKLSLEQMNFLFG